MASKWPDLFSRNVAVRAKPESLRVIVVAGMLGKWDELGDTDGGGLGRVDRAVDGLSTRVWSCFDCKNALNTDDLGEMTDSGSPKLVEFWLTYFASVLGRGF
jgi:hypothetical protein